LKLILKTLKNGLVVDLLGGVQGIG
jgi:hypothetical protein